MPADFSFGSMVFGEAAMKEKLPDDTYAALKETIREGAPLGRHIASKVASAMKDWALERGATHYTHWFQPLTGYTAEKHDSFLAPSLGGGAMVDFSGKELVMGEPDASSFPSGGLRATFEARGYTAWDPTAYAFIKDGTLCIPTVFCSYGGDALDKKMPLMRSADLIGREAKRMLEALGRTDIARITPNVGAEQEYFLVDEELYNRRRDLVLCSRTLFGAKPAKSQELDDHYFGAIAPRVQAFMRELDSELWKLGVYANTEHKEAAPGQYELAPHFTGVNTATDHNQLTMELLKRVASKHGLVCLLHEKPFNGVNGSGKHNNWSLAAGGENLFAPGADPGANLSFLMLLAAVIKAVDEHQDLMRFAVAGASNDLRLGGFEAPPAIISIFLGDDLTSLLDSIVQGSDYSAADKKVLRSGVEALPRLRVDSTDRNRTAPLAFTGNKFEFRMPGASQSIADANIVLNTIVAEACAAFADELAGADDVPAAALAMIRRVIAENGRVLYSGNCYSPEWVEEAKRRGLMNLPTTVDVLPRFIEERNICLFSDNGIFTEREMRSRYEISLESYAKVNFIEARTMVEISRTEILPAVIAYGRELAETASAKRALNLESAAEMRQVRLMDELTGSLDARTEALDALLARASAMRDSLDVCCFFRDAVIPATALLREAADALELVTSKRRWPFPTYEALITSAK